MSIERIILARVVYAVCTFYMMLVLLRWFGPWINVDFESPRLRWAKVIVDPPLNKIREILPPMGPIDFFSPLTLLVLVWVFRTLFIQGLIPAQ